MSIPRKRGPQRWTMAKDAALTAAWSAGTMIKIIAYDLGCCQSTIRYRVQKLGLAPRETPWSEHHTAYVRLHFPDAKMSIDAIAKVVGRSPNAVYMHAQRMGLHRRARYMGDFSERVAA